MQKNKISIFGLGYVGCVSLGCLAEQGNSIVGVDISEHKVDLINNGSPTVIEDKIGDIIAENHKKGRIRATKDTKDAVLNTDISIICVGTPSDEKGHLNLEYIFNTAKEIGQALKSKNRFHTIVIRSTVVPGTNDRYSAMIEEISGKVSGKDYAIVSNPEFLREGSAVDDYFNPPYTVLGSHSKEGLNRIRSLYRNLEAPVKVVDVKVAEMIKYVNNSFHALKISFTNEVGNICKKLGMDSHQLMSLFCEDEHLNISSAYLRPGFAYGGSCLPKDLKGLNALARDHHVSVPVLGSIHTSNEIQKENAFQIVSKYKKKSVGLIGLSFKEGTDDLRYSPAVDLSEKLLGKGYNLKIYDPNVQVSRLVGRNKSYIDQHIPHLAKLLVEDLGEVIQKSDLIILNQTKSGLENYANQLMEKTVVDLVNQKELKELANEYEGINW